MLVKKGIRCDSCNVKIGSVDTDDPKMFQKRNRIVKTHSENVHGYFGGFDFGVDGRDMLNFIGGMAALGVGVGLTFSMFNMIGNMAGQN